MAIASETRRHTPRATTHTARGIATREIQARPIVNPPRTPAPAAPVRIQALAECQRPIASATYSSSGAGAPAAKPRRERTQPPTRNRAIRLLNIAVAIVGLIITAPLQLVIAILVKLSSPGPILFTQPRIGLDRRSRDSGEDRRRRRVDLGGKPFRMYKFRTMRVDSPADGVWARPGDPRVTPVGRFLRSTRLDELPQLYNVVKGDMNIVGPRPEQPRIFLELDRSIVGYRERQKVPPGITGWAQVNCNYDQCLEDVKRKLAHDLEYIRRRCVAEDVRIMARTLPVMLFRRGAL